MNITKTHYNRYLEIVEHELHNYLETGTNADAMGVLGGAKLHIAVILSAVKDFHFGSEVNQASAVKFFLSRHFKEYVTKSLVPSKIFDRLLEDPEQNAEHILTAKRTEEEEDLSDLYC